MKNIPYFPLFIPLQGKNFLLYGAGAVGQRRIASLLPFAPQLTVIATQISPQLREKYATESICWQEKEYTPGEINGYDFVLAATSQTTVNHAIYQECKEKKIPVNNASCQEECDFFFPSIIQKEEITIGLCSGGQNHRKVRQTAADLRNIITD